jgi:hypothetical protein
MRLRAKVDANQGDIVRELRRAGCSVVSLAAVGKGVPDLLVGVRGRNYLLEVKDGAKPPSARRLTPDQRQWHLLWAGQVLTVTSAEDALRQIGLIEIIPSVVMIEVKGTIR